MIKLKNLLTEAEVSRELWYHIQNDISLEECVFRYGSKKYFLIMNEAKSLMKEGYEFDWKTKALLETDLGNFGIFEGEEVPLDFPLITEAKKKKKKKKDPPLRKPKRGGSKKFYVYVRCNGKIKKISFGSPDMPLRVSDDDRRKSFVARHKCKTQAAADPCTARYWSCRIGRYPNLTGASKKYKWW